MRKGKFVHEIIVTFLVVAASIVGQIQRTKITKRKDNKKHKS